MKPTSGKTGPTGPKTGGAKIASAKSGSPRTSTFAPPTPKMTRQKRAKVMTAVERAAFLMSRPDLKSS